MSFSKISAIAGALAFASRATAHGAATGIVADGVYYQGFSSNFNYMANPPKVVGWYADNQDNGFVDGTSYATGDIICHKKATPGGISATVAAGGTVEVQWNTWPESHHGPVIDYLAKCNGDCATVDKTTLEFFKIDGPGLIDGSSAPGKWASDELIANNNTWSLTIPSDIAPGNYVLRHEIIGLHAAGQANGAQNYPQCFNLEITGSGTATPAGVKGTELYTPTDPGILVSIFSLSEYIVPGPAIYGGGKTGATPPAASSAVAPSAPVATTPAATGSAPAVTAAPTLSTLVPIYSNGTATSTKKSACKSKSKTASAVLPTGTDAAPVEPTAAPAPAATSGPGEYKEEPTPTNTSPAPTTAPVEGGVSSLPSGTTLSSVLAWIKSFYTKNEGTTYTGASTLERRHPRAF